MRKVTNKLLEMMEEGALDAELLARAALAFMSEDDVRELAASNDLLTDLDDEDEEEDEEDLFDSTSDDEDE